MKVYYSELAFRKIKYWVQTCPVEISGFGLVKVEEGYIKVLDAFLLPQKCGAAHTDIEATDLSKALFKYRNHEGEVRLWWHSHVDMNTFWSGQDTKTIAELGQGGWIVATVFNKKEDYRTAVYIKRGKATPTGEEPLLEDEVETFFEHEEYDVEWEKEYKENFTETPVYMPPYYGKTDYDYSRYPLHDRKVPSIKDIDEQESLELQDDEIYMSDMRKTPVEQVKFYTKKQIKFLRRNHIEIDDANELLEEGFTPEQVIYIVKNGVEVDDVFHLLSQNTSITDILGMVVK